MKISVQVNTEEIKKLMNQCRDEADRAHNSALNRATKKVETELIDRAYEKINLKKSDLRNSVSVRGTAGEITIYDRVVSLISFLRSAPKRKPPVGLSIKLWRDKERVLYAGSFVAYGANDNLHIFKREGDSRLPIKKLHGKGLRDMWEVPSFSEGIIDIAQEEYSNRFLSTFNAFVANSLE